MKTLSLDRPCVVCNELPGWIQYEKFDGTFGVSIVGERGRIDEWHPTQVKPATVKEMAELTVKMLGKN